MDAILDQVKQKEAEKDKQEPHFVCQAGASPAEASLIELKASPEPYLIKVDNGYVKIQVTN
jgi:hypothetical protein